MLHYIYIHIYLYILDIYIWLVYVWYVFKCKYLVSLVYILNVFGYCFVYYCYICYMFFVYFVYAYLGFDMFCYFGTSDFWGVVLSIHQRLLLC